MAKFVPVSAIWSCFRQKTTLCPQLQIANQLWYLDAKEYATIIFTQELDNAYQGFQGVLAQRFPLIRVANGLVFNTDWPRQQNGTECGPMTCAAMECIARGVVNGRSAEYNDKDKVLIRKNVLLYIQATAMPPATTAPYAPPGYIRGGAVHHRRSINPYLSGGALLHAYRS